MGRETQKVTGRWKMIWDGVNETEIQKYHPSAVVYAMQTKDDFGNIVFDPVFGSPMLVIEERRNDRSWQGWVFEIGEDVV